jgi:hypothetical protein
MSARLTLEDRDLLPPARQQEYDRLLGRVTDAERAVAESKLSLGDAFWSDAHQPDRVRLFGTVDAAETTLERFIDSVADQLRYAHAAADLDARHAAQIAGRARLVAIAEETEQVHARLQELNG